MSEGTNEPDPQEGTLDGEKLSDKEVKKEEPDTKQEGE